MKQAKASLKKNNCVVSYIVTGIQNSTVATNHDAITYRNNDSKYNVRFVYLNT